MLRAFRPASATDSALDWHQPDASCRGAIMFRNRSGAGENGDSGLVRAATTGQRPAGSRRRAPAHTPKPAAGVGYRHFGCGRADAGTGGHPAARVPGVGRLQRPDQPDGRQVRAGRPRLRRREERPDQGVRQPDRHDADASSPTCARTSTTSGTAACSGMALDPDFPTQPVRLRPLHLRRTSSARPRRPALGTPGVYVDPCPTPPGATGDGCVVSGRLSRLRRRATS